MKSIGLIFFLCTFSAFSQEGPLFETDRIDLGNIELQGGSGKLGIPFTNPGKELLIIERAVTGDGGTYAEFPKEPTKPGAKGVITFVYMRTNPGPHSRSITVVSWQGKATRTQVLTVKYTIVYPPASVSADRPLIATHLLPFGESDTLTFELANTGTRPLYLFNPPFYSTVNKEIMAVKLEIVTAGGEVQKDTHSPCQPGERYRIQVVVTNIYGSAEPVKHHLDFTYNNGQSFSIPLMINGTGKSPKASILQYGRAFQYADGELDRLDEYDAEGIIQHSFFFKTGNCFRSTIRDRYARRYTVLEYSDGKEVSKTETPLESEE